jgi:type IV secretory pathway VirB9-like protein
MKHPLALIAIVLWSSFLMASTSAARHLQRKPSRSHQLPAVPADAEPRARLVHYGQKDVIKLKTKVRITTIIVLPQGEQILDFTCGDKDYWVVNGTQNLAYVKPAKEGAMTNLNLVTSAGNIYTFVLVEVSQLRDTEPDYKIFVQPKEESMLTTSSQAPRFVPASELEAYRKELQFAREETERIKKMAEETLDQELAKKVTSLHFSYRFQPDKKPFHVEMIYHDKTFTYIVAKPDETPTLYEIRDGKPNLIDFQYKHGVFVADKVIDRGYLAIGKQRLVFINKE